MSKTPKYDLPLMEYEVRGHPCLARHPRTDILPLDTLDDIPQHLGASRSQCSAFDNALLSAVNSICNELNAMRRQRAVHGREVQALQDLRVVAEPLERLSDMEFRRSSPCRSVNLSSASDKRRWCNSCGHLVCVLLALCSLIIG